MRAFDSELVDAVWSAVDPLLRTVTDARPLGCHRPRISDRVCFEGILMRLGTGCSWVDGRASGRRPGLRHHLGSRRDEWIAAGVFDRPADQAIAGYDRIVGLDLSDCSIDGSQHKTPTAGEGTGPSPVDRGKRGWKWSLTTFVLQGPAPRHRRQPRTARDAMADRASQQRAVHLQSAPPQHRQAGPPPARPTRPRRRAATGRQLIDWRDRWDR